jgi:dienelactone hydrolase
MVTAAQMRSAIDYVIRLASDGTSGDCGKIDTTKIASTGYSLGAAGAISVGADARITATFFFSGGFGGGGSGAANIKAPWAAITGENDTVATPANAQAFVNASTQPGFYAVLVGKDHNGVPGAPPSSESYIAFLRWRLMGDQAGRTKFVGASCSICTDTTNFLTVYSKQYDTL